MKDITLTKKDINELAQNISTEVKAEAIKKVGHYYNDTTLTPDERNIAEDIFRLMVTDTETKIRAILAETLKDSNEIPKDIVLKIVNDIDSVAVPFIREANVFSDGDLVEILKSQNINRQNAVAMREGISSNISQYIVDMCSEDIVETLLNNEKSDIVEKTYSAIVDKYQGNEKIEEKIIDRKQLPVPIIERIVSSLSDILQKKLLVNHKLPINVVSDIVERVRDKATLRISQEYSSNMQVDDLVSQLYKLNRLTPTLAVRAICMGNIKFFEYALVYLTKKKIVDIRKVLLNDKDEFIIRNLLRDANVPLNLFSAVICSLKIIKELNFDLEKEDGAKFTKKVIERVLTFDNINEKMDGGDIDYLISKIS